MSGNDAQIERTRLSAYFIGIGGALLSLSVFGSVRPTADWADSSRQPTASGDASLRLAQGRTNAAIQLPIVSVTDSRSTAMSILRTASPTPRPPLPN
jgi:hypothetical protein